MVTSPCRTGRSASATARRHEQEHQPFGEQRKAERAEGADQADQQRADQAPAIEPMPPITVTMKDSIRMEKPMPGRASAPARPARRRGRPAGRRARTPRRRRGRY